MANVNHQQLESAARRLWPYVRYFGLCGADPEATQAVVDMGKALGEIKASGDLPLTGVSLVAASTVIEAAEKTGERVAVDCAKWLENHRFCGRKVKRSDWAVLVEEFRQEAGRKK